MRVPFQALPQYHLNSPATKQIIEKTAAIAPQNFRVDCVEWIKEETGTTLGIPANAIWNFHRCRLSPIRGFKDSPGRKLHTKGMNSRRA